MKLTKSKQFLADAIHKSGKGWPDGANWAAQDKRTPLRGFDIIALYKVKPKKPRAGSDFWGGDTVESDVAGYIQSDKLIHNWHKTVLSREEYFSAYPAEPVADADGWIEWKGGDCPVGKNVTGDIKLDCGDKFDTDDMAMWNWSLENSDPRRIIAYRLHKPEVKPESCESVMRSIPDPDAKPAIEQLAADYRNANDYAGRKQREADAAKADAEAKLAAYVAAAGSAVGAVLAVVAPEPELVITDWRDLQENDWIWYGGDDEHPAGEYRVLDVEVPDYEGCRVVLVDTIGADHWIDIAEGWRFIRRP